MASFQEIMEKLGDNKPLTPQEKSDLSLMAREIDTNRALIGSWQRGQDKKVNPVYLDLPFVPIYSNVLEQDTLSITIQIPSNYNHLFLMGAGRTTFAGYNDAIIGTFNDDSGANYRHQYDGAQNTTQLAAQATGRTSFIFGDFTGTSASSGAQGSFFSFIPHISGGFWKTIISLRGISQWSATDLVNIFYTAHWENTSRITSIKVSSANGANLLAGSLFSVLGIK